MIIDDIMDHVRNSHMSIEKALMDTRRAVADELGRPDYNGIRLNASEVSRTVRPFINNFFQRHPEYSNIDHATRSDIIRKLDKLKICMFLLQFPERIQDVVQQFRFENRLAAESSSEMMFIYAPLLRSLDRALSSPENLKDQIPFFKALAGDVLGRLPVDADPSAVRALMEIIDYTVHAFPKMEHRRQVFQAPSIDTVHERPANDNHVAAPIRMR
mgnify:CR=1 FL=1|jgi:hypothetical protein